jgi:nucleoid DNA-binding protein
MHSLITSYLLQAGKCALPGIGFFKIKHTPAEIDIVNKQMLPPVEEIIFNEEAIFLSQGLINYVAHKKSIPVSESENLLNNFCREWKEKIEAGEKFCFATLGCLEKNDAGVVSFEKEENPEYFKPVFAQRVLHQNAEHTVLVGDRETTSTVMNEYYKEELPVVKRRWFVGAIVLAVIASLTIFFSFYGHRISVSAIGNRNHLNIKSAGETHFKP